MKTEKMSRSGAEIRASENQSKFIQDRIAKVESHFGELCTTFAAMSRKLGKVRDRGDEVSKAIMTYAENESHNPTTQLGLKEFSENFSGVQDYRNAEIRRLEDKVIGPLQQYGNACKHAKERLKNAYAARHKELRQKKNLDKVIEKAPSDRHQISAAETELKMASVDASRTSRTLEEEMDSFEKKKLQDIKSILVDFVNIELLYHAKALEMYTSCFQSLNQISEEEDLEEFHNSMRPYASQSRQALQRTYSQPTLNTNEFRNSLRPASSMTRLEMQRSHSKNSLNGGTLNTTSQSQSAHNTPVGRRRQEPQPGDTLNSTQPSSMYTSTMNGEDEDDDDDDEDDDDDDDEDDDEDEDDEEDDSYQQKFANNNRRK